MSVATLSVPRGFGLQTEANDDGPVRQSTTLIEQSNSAQRGSKVSQVSKTQRLSANSETVLSEDTIRNWVAGALDDLGPVKAIARDANVTGPAVKNWMLRRSTMSLSAAVHLALSSPRFRAALAVLIGIDPKLLRAQEALALAEELHRVTAEFVREEKG